MKEQSLIDEQIKSIKEHPGNISSNLGDNLPFKEKLEDIVNNAASIHTEFNVALNGICTVIKKINTFVHQMEARKINSKKIKGANPETQYYPNSYLINKHDKVTNPQVRDPKSIMQNIQAGVSMKPKGKIVPGNAGKGAKKALKVQKKMLIAAKKQAKKAKAKKSKKADKKEEKKNTKKEREEEESFLELEEIKKRKNVDNN